jgi:hypothetical protein
MPTTSWFHTLLVDKISPRLKVNLFNVAKEESRRLAKMYPKTVQADRVAFLQDWYASESGKAALAELFRKIWHQMAGISMFAMPAHDARHAIYKVPATALEYIYAESVTGYERIGIFGALLHDHGRWAEERIMGEPGASMLHSRLGALLAEELTQSVDLPPEVRSQIINAVLQHTVGADPSDVMPTKITVSADRDQLYGPELVLRLLHHVVRKGDCGSVYGEKPGTIPILDEITHYFMKRLPGPLFSRRAHSDILRHLSLTFVLMCEERPASEIRFADTNFEYQGSQFNWAHEWERANSLLPQAESPQDELFKLLNAHNTAPGAAYMIEALDKLSHVPEQLRCRLAGALCWINGQRIEQDWRQEEQLARMVEYYASGGDPVLAEIAGVLLAGWQGAQA